MNGYSSGEDRLERRAQKWMPAYRQPGALAKVDRARRSGEHGTRLLRRTAYIECSALGYRTIAFLALVMLKLRPYDIHTSCEEPVSKGIAIDHCRDNALSDLSQQPAASADDFPPGEKVPEGRMRGISSATSRISPIGVSPIEAEAKPSSPAGTSPHGGEAEASMPGT